MVVLKNDDGVLNRRHFMVRRCTCEISLECYKLLEAFAI
jgi:hypothetical protein